MQLLLFSFALPSKSAVPMLEHLFSALLHPNESLKTSVLYAWIKLVKTVSSSAAQSLPAAIRDRVCIVLLQTLTNASSPSLINNCVGKWEKWNHLFVLDLLYQDWSFLGLWWRCGVCCIIPETWTEPGSKSKHAFLNIEFIYIYIYIYGFVCFFRLNVIKNVSFGKPARFFNSSSCCQ